MLNIYTNALSALVLDIKTNRWKAVVVGGIVGFFLALYGSGNFGGFYQTFLLLLDYWITPWLGIIVVDFFVLKNISPKTLNSLPIVSWKAIVSYGVGILVSVLFIPSISYINYVGPASQLMGGADFSYFVSFIIAAVLYYVLMHKH